MKQHAPIRRRVHPREKIGGGWIVAYINFEGFENRTHRIANCIIIVYDVDFALSPIFHDTVSGKARLRAKIRTSRFEEKYGFMLSTQRKVSLHQRRLAG